MGFGKHVKKWWGGGYKEQIREAMENAPPAPAPQAVSFIAPTTLPNAGIIPTRNPAGNIMPMYPMDMASRMFRGYEAPFGGYRRHGGRVRPGRRYIVGEDGPEEIILDQPGTVIPNDDLHGDMTAEEKYASRPLVDPVPAEQPAGERLFRTNNPYAPNPTVGSRNNPYTPNPAVGDAFQPPVTAEQPITITDAPPMALAAGSPAASVPFDERYAPMNAGFSHLDERPLTLSPTGDQAEQFPDQESGPGADEDPRASRLFRERQREPQGSDRLWGEIEKTYEPGEREPSLKKRLLSGIKKGSDNWDGTGGIIGWLGSAIFGGAGSAASPKYYDNITRERRRNGLFRDLGIQQKREEWQTVQDYYKARTNNINEDNLRARDTLEAQRRYREGLLAEQEMRRLSVERNTRMRTVASMLGKIENYDPANPKFKEVTAALGDLRLPVAPKDSKKKIQLVQDADSGAWTLTLTDPFDGRQEVRPVTDKFGKQLVTTSSAKLAADAAGVRQRSEQSFRATQNAEDRRMRLQEYVRKNNISRAKFQAELAEKVAAGKLTEEQANAIMADFPNDVR